MEYFTHVDKSSKRPYHMTCLKETSEEVTRKLSRHGSLVNVHGVTSTSAGSTVRTWSFATSSDLESAIALMIARFGKQIEIDRRTDALPPTDREIDQMRLSPETVSSNYAMRLGISQVKAHPILTAAYKAKKEFSVAIGESRTYYLHTETNNPDTVSVYVSALQPIDTGVQEWLKSKTVNGPYFGLGNSYSVFEVPVAMKERVAGFLEGAGYKESQDNRWTAE